RRRLRYNFSGFPRPDASVPDGFRGQGPGEWKQFLEGRPCSRHVAAGFFVAREGPAARARARSRAAATASTRSPTVIALNTTLVVHVVRTAARPSPTTKANASCAQGRGVSRIRSIAQPARGMPNRTWRSMRGTLATTVAQL